MSTTLHNFSDYMLSDTTHRTSLSSALYDSLICGLVFTILLFSEIGRNPLDFEKINVSAVTSLLMPTSHESYRARLRLVIFRKPRAHPHPSEPRLISISVSETLECGHKLDIYPGEHEPLIAKRRRCQKCKEGLVVPFPNRKFIKAQEAA